MIFCSSLLYTFFLNDTATTEIYTLSLHDALPICTSTGNVRNTGPVGGVSAVWMARRIAVGISSTRSTRSEEHTSELQSRRDLVCRLLLEKKRKQLNLQSGRETIDKSY